MAGASPSSSLLEGSLAYESIYSRVERRTTRSVHYMPGHRRALLSRPLVLLSSAINLLFLCSHAGLEGSMVVCPFSSFKSF
jgi:hypothetical protein